MITIGTLENTRIDTLLERGIIKKVLHPFYYIPVINDDESARVDYNFFTIRNLGVNQNKNTVEPVEFLNMLTELSDKVTEGNNYSGVAKCLNLDNGLLYMAMEADKKLADLCVGG